MFRFITVVFIILLFASDAGANDVGILMSAWGLIKWVLGGFAALCFMIGKMFYNKMLLLEDRQKNFHDSMMREIQRIHEKISIYRRDSISID